jgi:hypothetical protein
MAKQMPAIALLAALFLLGTGGCVHHVHHGGGPPPHAPAHGYRYHHGHDDVDLVWDAHLGVYAVVGFPALYFWDGYYYRYRDDHWQRGAGPHGQWKAYRGHVPPGLAKKHHIKHKNFRRGKARHW